MTVATQLEILDLRHFSARQLRGLLEAEAHAWEQRLRWNYKSSTELLLQYLDSRILPGFVALDRGRVCGFTFCVYEGHKAVIGDAYAADPDPTKAAYITQTLLRQMLDLLRHSPNINRIEAQLLMYDSGSIASSFLESGFTMYRRLFMELNLSDINLSGGKNSWPDRQLEDGIELCGWSAEYYQPAAELVYESYVGHPDSLINDQYCSLHGSLRFLHNIVRFPGCGVFEGSESWLLRRGGQLIGMILCSRVAPKVAHITQLCLARSERGNGYGTLLLAHSMNHLAQSGFSVITLTVTGTNSEAVHLYEKMGFSTLHEFDAMVLKKD